MRTENLSPENEDRLLSVIEARVYAVMRNTPDHHGITHVSTVRKFGRLIGALEGGNLFNIQATALLHDIRWFDEGDRVVRKLTRATSEYTHGETPLGILRLVQGEISTDDYDDIATAIAVQDEFPNPEHPASLTTRCSRDANRLSRSGVEGLLSILEANKDYQTVPFYTKGGEIERSHNAPVMPYEAIKSCVDDINACLDWEKIMETTAGAELAQTFNRVNRAFLKTFALHQELSYETWIAWLRSVAVSQKDNRALVHTLISQGQPEEGKRRLIVLEIPGLLGLENFERFYGSFINS